MAMEAWLHSIKLLSPTLLLYKSYSKLYLFASLMKHIYLFWLNIFFCVGCFSFPLPRMVFLKPGKNGYGFILRGSRGLLIRKLDVGYGT